ncbi:MAG: DUF6932 family protein [Aridibacter sp.]
MVFPEFNKNSNLPVGIYEATLQEVLELFGQGSLQRQLIAKRLSKIYDLADINTDSIFYKKIYIKLKTLFSQKTLNIQRNSYKCLFPFFKKISSDSINAA